jgi:hypothetical protein
MLDGLLQGSISAKAGDAIDRRTSFQTHPMEKAQAFNRRAFACLGE